MRVLKRTLIVVITALLLIGVCGCAKTKNKETLAEEMQAEALAYLNDRYTDTFTPNVYTSSNWAYEYESITFTSGKYPRTSVEVRAYKNNDGTYRFKDNYFRCDMMDGAISYGKSLIEENPAVVKARFPNTVWSDELDGAISFEEWKAQGTACVDLFVITGYAFSTDVQEGIVSKAAEDKVCGSVVFIITDDENLLSGKTLDEILNNHNKFVVGKNTYTIESP